MASLELMSESRAASELFGGISRSTLKRWALLGNGVMVVFAVDPDTGHRKYSAQMNESFQAAYGARRDAERGAA